MRLTPNLWAIQASTQVARLLHAALTIVSRPTHSRALRSVDEFGGVCVVDEI